MTVHEIAFTVGLTVLWIIILGLTWCAVWMFAQVVELEDEWSIPTTLVAAHYGNAIFVPMLAGCLLLAMEEHRALVVFLQFGLLAVLFFKTLMHIQSTVADHSD